MSKSTPHNILVSLLFLLFICLPLSVSLLSVDESVSKTEKRKLAKFPEFEISLKSLKEFPRAFDSYIEDHFGLRVPIVRAHNYAMVKVFGVSPTGFVVIGSDDWYFFSGDGAIRDYLGGFTLGPRKLEKIYHLLLDRKYWLNSLGIEYIFLPVPNKETVYDEFLPISIRENRGVTTYTRILDYLEKRKLFRDFINVERIMLDEKEQATLYLRTDSHWNHDGAFLIYRKIVERAQEWYPDLVPLQRKQDTEMIYNFSGDLSILMNLRGLITEDAPGVVIDEACEVRPLKRMSWLKEIDQYRNLEKRRFPVITGCQDQKRTAIVIHDSFGRFLRPYLSQQFKRVIYINHFNFEDAKSLIEREKPDIVIDQRVARRITRALMDDHELEHMVLRDTFDKLTDKPLVIAPRNGTQLGTGVKGLEPHDKKAGEFDLRPDQPPVRLRINKPGSPEHPTILKLDVESDRNAQVSFCYQGITDSGTTIPQCSRREMKVGDNLLFFRIVLPNDHGWFEFKSETPTTLSVHSIVVKKEDITSLRE